MTIKLRSPAFAPEQRLGREYTADGAGISPPLTWDTVPPGTRELVIVCDDPDAPERRPWVHWLIYKLPGDLRLLSADVPADPKLRKPPGVLQGRNSWTSGRTIGYRGPAPPPGETHRYRFRIFALNAELPLEPGLDGEALERAMSGHVLAEGELTAIYSRPVH